MLPQWPILFYDVHPNWYRWHWSHPKFLPASLQILCWKWQVEGMACPGHLDVWIRHISRVLPPYSKRKLFWTGTRSPKFNWLLIFVKIFIAKWYIYIYMKIFFKTNLFIWYLYFETQQLKNYSYLYSQCLTQTFFWKWLPFLVWSIFYIDCPITPLTPYQTHLKMTQLLAFHLIITTNQHILIAYT